MKNISIILFVVAFNLFSAAHAQDEMSQEIDKLESGNVETKESVVPEDPAVSADQVEEELDKEMTPKKVKKVAKPEETPIEPEEKEITETPSEEPITPLEEPEEAPKKADDFKPVNPPPPKNIEEDLTPVEENIAEPAPTPEPVIDAQPEEKADVPPPVETPVAVEEQAVPDDFEQRLNRIYNKFYTESTSDSVWTQIAGEKINENYTVQPGDTLWDISVTFFGNGHYWPKVWQMNDDITNPHIISPGYVLRFTPGKIDKAPQINITQNNPTTPKEVPAGTVAQNEAPQAKMDAAPVIPPPEKKSVPVLKNLPASLPYISGPKYTGFDASGFALDDRKAAIEDAAVFLSSYLSETEPTMIGKVVEMDDEDIEKAMLYEDVYIRFDETVHIGDRFLTYQLGDKIKNFQGEVMGKPINLEGEIQVTELVNAKKNVYKAKVLRAVNFVSVGSYVMKGSLIRGDTAMTTDTGNIAAEVVGGDFENDRKFTGMQEAVYLSKGSNEGVKEGQIFTVYKNMEARKDSTYIRDLKEKIAQVKIIKTTPERSTAIILKSRQEIHTGDFIGAKEFARNDEIKDMDFDNPQKNSDDMDNPDESSNSDMDSDDGIDLIDE